jgi:oxygen-independent coproporphyrinogen-3 oxidase
MIGRVRAIPLIPRRCNFAMESTASDYERAAATSPGANQGMPLSLYVHIPFCLSPCFYCGCNKIVTRRLDRADTYVRHLLREISQRGGYFGRERTVEQMHFGGGTPTYLPRQLLIEVIDRIDHEFQLTDAESRDYSIEIDPRGLDGGMLPLLAALGFNRISLGVQDFDENVQRAVNRVQASRDGGAGVRPGARIGLSLDQFRLDLRLAEADSPDVRGDAQPGDRDASGPSGGVRLRAYAAGIQSAAADLPGTSSRMRRFGSAFCSLAVEKLCAAGYVYIGMDHFALPTDSLAQAHHERHLAPEFPGLYDSRESRPREPRRQRHRSGRRSCTCRTHKALGDYEGAVAMRRAARRVAACA